MILVNGQQINICIINVYYGSLPKYFSLWLKSASLNSNIDFFIFGNCSYKGDLPDNIKMYNIDLNEVRKRASQILRMNAILDTPYKLCDYKVLYGLIFKEYIKEYDYWGHCDLDLIWGNLEKCFIDNNITEYDKFLPLGHLSLYKNKKDINLRILSSGGVKNYKEIYSTNDICRADESWGIIPIYLNHNWPFFKKKTFADILCTHKRFTLSGTSYQKGEIIQNFRHQVFVWDNGKIYRLYLDNAEIKMNEYAYIYFMRSPNYTVTFDEKKCNSFLISSHGFTQISLPLTIKEIKKYGEYPGPLKEWWEIHKHDLKYWIIDHYNLDSRNTAL